SSVRVLDLIGGRTRTRTWDPLIKSQLLYQLSYAPGVPPAKAPQGLRPVAKRVPTVQQGPVDVCCEIPPPLVPARGTPRRSRRGDPVAGTKPIARRRRA